MKKMIALSLCLASTTWAAHSQIHSLIPTKNPILNMPQKTFKSHLSLISTLVKAGGFGGNEKSGKLVYSGKPDELPSLTVSREAQTGQCYLENKNTHIVDSSESLILFPCTSPDPNHNQLYWNENLGAVNGGFSPENDALYAADVITAMFQNWYGIPPMLNEKGFKEPLYIKLHQADENAYTKTEGSSIHILIGDGKNEYYPFTSLNIFAYLVGQIFTEQHSKLLWYGDQVGAINIAFSCITAMAAEFYATQKNSWQIGNEIAKNGVPIHYMDIPSKNCNGRTPGYGCDIDTLSQYSDRTSNYDGSGLFNRAFYLLATTSGWDTHKAYDVFVQANRHHWKDINDFHAGACGVVTSAKELRYDTKSVVQAFSGVGINTQDC